jgi:hypothetical protein
LCEEVVDVSVLADTLIDLVMRGLFGVDKFPCIFSFPASGDEGMVDILRLVLRPVVTLPSEGSFRPPRFRIVTPSPAFGVTLLRLGRVVVVVVVTDCGSSSFSTLSLRSVVLDELSRVLRR